MYIESQRSGSPELIVFMKGSNTKVREALLFVAANYFSDCAVIAARIGKGTRKLQAVPKYPK